MAFVDEEYLLESPAATRLYDEIRDLSIVDPHSHVDVQALAANDGWSDVWEVEGATDHYVWQLMRKRGVPERKVTGDASNREKWNALAAVFPEFAGNPTYEWVQLDLKRRSASRNRSPPRLPTRSGRRRRLSWMNRVCARRRSSKR